MAHIQDHKFALLQLNELQALHLVDHSTVPFQEQQSHLLVEQQGYWRLAIPEKFHRQGQAEQELK